MSCDSVAMNVNIKLLAQGNTEELTAIRKKLHEELKESRERGILTVAFMGQYNAEKSTTISALTGRRDIHDAKDYCEGVDEEDDFLLEVSRFQTFINALYSFVERRAALTRFDTPVRIALSSVDEAQLSFTRNSTQDSAFFEVLTRLSRTVRKERDRVLRCSGRVRSLFEVK